MNHASRRHTYAAATPAQRATPACLALVLLLAGAALPAARAHAAQIDKAGGGTVNGRIIGLQQDALLVAPAEKDKPAAAVALDDITTITLDGADRARAAHDAIATASATAPATQPATAPATHPADARTWSLALAGDDYLAVSVEHWTSAALDVRVKALDDAPLHLGFEQIRGIWATDAALVRQAQALTVDNTAHDIAFIQQKDKVASVAGVAIGMDRDALLFRFQDQDRRIKLDRLVGVLLAQRKPHADRARYAVLTLTGGDVLSGRLKQLAHGIIDLTPRGAPADAPPLRVPLAHVERLAIRNGNLQWLDELAPVAVEQTPFFDRLMPYQVNKNLIGGELSVRGRRVRRGICVHSRCVLTYDLAGGFATFRAAVGLQQPQGKLGHVAARVLGDGKVLWEKPDLAGDADATNVQVSVAGVKQLVLEADFGPDADVGDWLVWGDARLLKISAATTPATP